MTHVWITTFIDGDTRTQRRVACLRQERGLAVTYSGYERELMRYTLTHLATGKSICAAMPEAQALAALASVVPLTDWEADEPQITWDKLAACGLVKP